MEFAQLSKLAQVNRLRLVAKEMLAHYPVEIKRVKLLVHLFNTTFAVEAADGRKFALRINTNSKREPEEMNSEVAWVNALARDTHLRVPVPQTTREGGMIAEAHCPSMGRDLRGVLYSWLPGPTPWRNVTPELTLAMGEATAIMHQHAATFKMPAGCELHQLKDPLFGYPYVLRDFVPDLDHDLFLDVFEQSNALIRRFQTGRQMPIHYDLHMGNVKWSRGKLAVFDFDDTILGVPIFDAYVSIYYLRSRESWQDLEAAFWRGLGATPEALGATREEFELLVASRSILLANEMYRWQNAAMETLAPKYVRVTETRLKRYKETGIFDPLVAKVT